MRNYFSLFGIIGASFALASVLLAGVTLAETRVSQDASIESVNGSLRISSVVGQPVQILGNLSVNGQDIVSSFNDLKSLVARMQTMIIDLQTQVVEMNNSIMELRNAGNTTNDSIASLNNRVSTVNNTATLSLQTLTTSVNNLNLTMSAVAVNTSKFNAYPDPSNLMTLSRLSANKTCSWIGVGYSIDPVSGPATVATSCPSGSYIAGVLTTYSIVVNQAPGAYGASYYHTAQIVSGTGGIATVYYYGGWSAVVSQVCCIPF